MAMRFGIGHLFALTAACASLYSWWAPGPEYQEPERYALEFELKPVPYFRVRTLAEWQALNGRIYWTDPNWISGSRSFVEQSRPHEEIPVPNLERADLFFFDPNYEREPILGMEFLDQPWAHTNPISVPDFAAELKLHHNVEFDDTCPVRDMEFNFSEDQSLERMLRLNLGSCGEFRHFEVDGRTIRILPDRKSAQSEIRSRGNGLVQLLVATDPVAGEGGPSGHTRYIPKYSTVWVLSPFAANCLDVIATLLSITLPFGMRYLVQRLLKRRPELATANT